MDPDSSQSQSKADGLGSDLKSFLDQFSLSRVTSRGRASEMDEMTAPTREEERRKHRRRCVLAPEPLRPRPHASSPL